MTNAEYMREYRKRPDVKQKIKEYNRKAHRSRWDSMSVSERREFNAKKLYGLSYREIEEMFEAQHKKCSTCKDEATLSSLVVDHCHSSKSVRGLICNSCNKALGFVKDNTETLKQMIKYLEKNNGR